MKTIKPSEYDMGKHEKYRAITIKQPFADNITYGANGIIVEKQTQYRGKLIVCSASKPNERYFAHYSRTRLNRTICEVNVIDCVQISKISSKQWKQLTKLPLSEKTFYRHAFILIIEYERTLLPYYVTEHAGIWHLIVYRNVIKGYEGTREPLHPTNKWWNFIWLILLVILACIAMFYHLTN